MGKRILVVDDDKATREILGCLFKCRGRYEITFAENGREALNVILSEPTKFDLVVTDIEMPEMNGLELVRMIRQKDIAIGIILFSGNYAHGNNKIFEEVRDIIFLKKPTSQETIMEKVREMIRK